MRKSIAFVMFITSLNLVQAQEHSAHCEHHCHIQKESIGPQYQDFYKAKGSFITNGLTHYIGSTHQHSGFSDGYPGTTPADYFKSGRSKNFDFVLGADHSDSYILPVTLHENCASAELLKCIAINPTNILGSVLKWPRFKNIVEENTDSNFVGVRGFEWTSDRFGHINVYFSKHITNAKTDGGYVLMETFWNWLTADPVDIFGLEAVLGGYGASDGIGVFNHPGDKSLFDEDPGFNWNNFEYIPEADSQMVGIEVFNDGKDYAANGLSYYQQVLDAGWHVGAIASEDHHDTLWNNAENEKTVMMAASLTHEGLKQAMLQRRTYAVRDFNLRMEFFAGDHLMGSRIQRKTGSLLQFSGKVATDFPHYIEVLSNGGEVLHRFPKASFEFNVVIEEKEKWYYLRVVDAIDSTSIAYSSPIWVRGGGDIVEEPVGINENKRLNVSIYPNPVTQDTDRIFLENINGVNEVELLSADGSKLNVEVVNQSQNTLELRVPFLCAGLYIIHGQGEGKIFSEVLIVE